MTGTSTPRLFRSLSIISGTAAAACSVLTVTRTSCEPAWASRATWIAVASASAVSVLVIDWTTTGWALPTRTPPTSTLTVPRLRGRRESGLVTGGRASSGIGLAGPVRPDGSSTSGRVRSSRPALSPSTSRPAGQNPDDVEAADPDQEGEQEDEAD